MVKTRHKLKIKNGTTDLMKKWIINRKERIEHKELNQQVLHFAFYVLFAVK